ncbi:cyclase family protein [Paenibacillus sp. D2_2]|uniref:cyclase family protein n=1 Tax=Paenibacillus sp. D2_2 TaxID=3073092 RepID=UPI002815A62E|nr:cyclase family protein [Paenibacillus sp. D2_2]WMT43013.1 cyclase family protein [Paenibacillus sp. D2_2]
MLIDLTHLIQDGMPVYPGDQETSLRQSKHIKQDYYNNHQLDINMHAGTHIDGPMHLLDIQHYLSEFPLEQFIGQACLLDVSGRRL